MKSLPTAKESVRLLFKHMTLRYAAERYPDVNITYQFIFTDIDDGYPIAISFRGGKSDYHEGMSEQPAVTIRTPSDIWLDLYLEPFLEGIRRAGTETEVIHLYEKNILPCRGCFNCWVKTPGRCVQSDDQRDLNDKLDTADLIVYAVPLYYHSVPGQVKNHLDRQIARMYPYFERSGNLTRHPRRVYKKAGYGPVFHIRLSGGRTIRCTDENIRGLRET